MKAKLVIHSVDGTQRIDEIIDVAEDMTQNELRQRVVSKIPEIRELTERLDEDVFRFRLENP